ncbi:DUF4407 domain-containing protein [Tsukamurella spumae]|uniref:DUF4407 domain-containing protein n=1 Tax=Tsukamurella spumae TaxID=44753 RepID=A0A846X345_9ACTN|nr:DUF4407 domain-containing protein [Tsukamurella spumae]NKY18749.1 DUF4407 domain-containing protein [Tsukamurella spumae]
MTTVLVLAVLAALVGGTICLLLAVPGRRAPLPGRFLVAVLIGLVVGETVSMLALNGAIEDRLRADAVAAATAVPAVRAAQADLDAARADRAALDSSVTEASARRDQALVVARCEYRPGPACPQTSITGVPGQGPETRTANQRLAAAQADLDRATAARAARSPALDARVERARSDAQSAREAAVADGDDGIGARWVALNGVTVHSFPAAALRIVIDLVSIVLALLPLLLRLWRGDTTRDIRRRQELESERLAAAAQLAIDRGHQERRIEIALAQDHPTRVLEAAGFEPVAVTARRYVREAPSGPAPSGTTVASHAPDDDFLPIAAAAEAASLAALRPDQPVADETPTGPIPVITSATDDPEPAEEATVSDRTNPPVPARATETAPAVPQREVARTPNPFVPPVLDDAARTLAGFVRPLVPPIVARVLPGVQQTRTIQQSYEEVEEVTFSMRRTRKVTVGTVEQSAAAPSSDGAGLSGQRPGELGQPRELPGG